MFGIGIGLAVIIKYNWSLHSMMRHIGIVLSLVTLGFTDGVLSGAIIGHDIMSNEKKSYAQISILRGETLLKMHLSTW